MDKRSVLPVPPRICVTLHMDLLILKLDFFFLLNICANIGNQYSSSWISSLSVSLSVSPSVSVYMCVCMYVEGRDWHRLSSSVALNYFFFWDWVSHWTWSPLISIGWLASPRNPPVSAFSAVGLQVSASETSFPLFEFWISQLLDPHAPAAGKNLSTEKLTVPSC